MKNQNITDRKTTLREKGHLTRPPRLEGRVKNAKMNPVRKIKKIISRSVLGMMEPVYRAEDGYKEYYFGNGFGENFEDDEY